MYGASSISGDAAAHDACMVHRKYQVMLQPVNFDFSLARAAHVQRKPNLLGVKHFIWAKPEKN